METVVEEKTGPGTTEEEFRGLAPVLETGLIVGSGREFGIPVDAGEPGEGIPDKGQGRPPGVLLQGDGLKARQVGPGTRKEKEGPHQAP
jgi:hypothetical protein